MLSQISWSSYFEFVAIVLIIYYSIVLVAFYKSDIKKGMSLKFQASSPLSNTGMGISEDENTPQQVEPPNRLVDEIKALIRQAGYNLTPKEEILSALRRLFLSEGFESIDRSLFKVRINTIIAKECKAHCSIHLSEEDLSVVWL